MVRPFFPFRFRRWFRNVHRHQNALQRTDGSGVLAFVHVPVDQLHRRPRHEPIHCGYRGAKRVHLRHRIRRFRADAHQYLLSDLGIQSSDFRDRHDFGHRTEQLRLLNFQGAFYHSQKLPARDVRRYGRLRRGGRRVEPVYGERQGRRISAREFGIAFQAFRRQ